MSCIKFGYGPIAGERQVWLKAIALNKIKSKYYLSIQNRLYSRHISQSENCKYLFPMPLIFFLFSDSLLQLTLPAINFSDRKFEKAQVNPKKRVAVLLLLYSATFKCIQSLCNAYNCIYIYI